MVSSTFVSRIASHIALGKPQIDGFCEWKIEFGPARTFRPAEALVQRRPTGQSSGPARRWMEAGRDVFIC